MIRNLNCQIARARGSYEITIQKNVLEDSQSMIQLLKPFGSRFAIISDETVATLYGQSLCHLLVAAGLEAFLFSFPDGEQFKTRATKESLEDQLFERKFGRDICLIAIGGGVVSDIGGYLAATYCRGVSLIIIPTSLLGMVDASIGGKNGVNVPQGKNLIGCINQPVKVIIDPQTLLSLPAPEIKNGVVEMIKHGLIADQIFFQFLSHQAGQILELNLDVLELAIFESCRIKKEIVEQDEKEKGKRHLLNFGHTIGHALEKVSNYTLSHGEAVAIGLLVEGHIAVQMGVLAPKEFTTLHHILIQYALPLQLFPPINTDDILNAMQFDKKSIKTRPRFIILQNIGLPLTFNGAYCTHVEENLIYNALQWMKHALCCH